MYQYLFDFTNHLSLTHTHTHTLLSLSLSHNLFIPYFLPIPSHFSLSPSLSLSLLLSRLLSESCQKVLFSATYSDEVMSFAKQVVPDPIVIRLKRSEESLDNIKQVIEVHVHTDVHIIDNISFVHVVMHSIFSRFNAYMYM